MITELPEEAKAALAYLNLDANFQKPIATSRFTAPVAGAGGRVYVGERDLDGTAHVYVLDHGKQSDLYHAKRHSPTGLEWGYAGSGPADLARSLLLDATGSMDGYMDFKFCVVAHLPRWEWRIPADAVRVIAEALRMQHAGMTPQETQTQEANY